MCGISGIFRPGGEHVPPDSIYHMLAQIQHRGPDESGIFTDENLGMGSVRLSIIDLEHGQQPMGTVDGSLWIAFNGEIFNHPELRRELEGLGHSFQTNSDTEVLLLLFQHFRERCLWKLNGQFSFAIWDTRTQELFMARDRLGIRPCFYHNSEKAFLFASEMKSLFETGLISAELDPLALNQLFTFWSVPGPSTIFKGVHELPPGHYLIRNKDKLQVKRYWEMDFAARQERMASKGWQEKQELFSGLLSNAIKLRLRSDVPVAAYLSGGLDSSATTHLIKQEAPGRLNTFSIGFRDREFDETPYQELVSEKFGTQHFSTSCDSEDIASNFTQVIWHAETPLLRTAPVPMFLLSRLVNQHGIKVVITGEGADEFLGGYNIFKEALIREFWSRQPDSKFRPLLLEKLYPYLGQFKNRRTSMHKLFFGHRLQEVDSPAYSHLVRWNNAPHLLAALHPDIRMDSHSLVNHYIERMPDMHGMDVLSRAQWLESELFLPGYLLSSQGDRMGMANSVEGRYPFLDHHVVEFAMGLSARDKIRGLNEKYILKQAMKDHLPEAIIDRPKQAYRAPVSSALETSEPASMFQELLSEHGLRDFGIFDPGMVQKLRQKMRSTGEIKETENMAITGILSTQVLLDLFIKGNNRFHRSKLHSPPQIITWKR